jgi:hypothetical protein
MRCSEIGDTIRFAGSFSAIRVTLLVSRNSENSMVSPN